jgi:O-antigen ligase
MNLDLEIADRNAAWWLAAAFVVMPLLQVLPIDFDRVGVLFLLAPAFWAGRYRLFEAVQRIVSGPHWIGLCLMLIGASVMASAAAADQPAAAIVTSASWILLAATGLLAGRLLAVAPSAQTSLLRGLTSGTAVGILSTWALWLANSRGPILLYPHPRILGLHMLAGAVSSVALLLKQRTGRCARAWEWIAGMLTWGGLLWSGGRAPLLAAVVGLGVWARYANSPTRKSLFIRSGILCAAGLAVSATMWTSQPQLGWWHAIVRTTAAMQETNVDALTSTRNDFWRAAAHHGMVSPWLGHGPDAYRFFTPKLDGQQPHNFILQLWLDLGVCGLLPALALVFGVLLAGWRQAKSAEKIGIPPDFLPWLALLVASLTAGMLDGVFYHLLAFLPAAVAFGRVLDLAIIKNPVASSVPIRAGVTALMSFAACVLLFHTWLFSALAVAPPPASPTAWSARCLRVFPSTTFGLWRWLDAWQGSQPEASLAWAQWAESHSPSAVFFHVYAAQCQLARGNRAGAESELRAALAKAHWTVRPGIEKMLEDINSRPH